MAGEIIQVNHLSAYYKEKEFLFHRKSVRKQILQDISFSIQEGELVGLVGESGCGKSTLGKAVLGMVKDVEGEVLHYSSMPQMIFQDPYGSLNPVRQVGWILEEPLRIRGGYTRAERMEQVLAMLKKVGLEEKLKERYPGELSGGQRQRVCIALSLMLQPKLIIADEPVSALDVTVQAQIMELLFCLNQEFGIAILFISHDLKVVYQLCSRILVMRAGRIIEQGSDREIYYDPKREYTRELLKSAGI
ncbi:MAG: ATP-binding cassette domain-containing protein [Lachnospiraceae bacterium]